MPALAAIPWLVPLITGVGAATGIGSTIYNLTQNSGSSNSAAQTAAQSAAQQQAAQTSLNQKEAIIANEGQAQSQTGGSLTSTGNATLASLLGGAPTSGSNLNSILASLGQRGGTVTPGPISGGATTPGQQQQAPGTLNLSDLLAQAG